MQDCALRFALAAFAVRDWNRDLSPWEAPPVFGKLPFGGMAEETLSFVLGRLFFSLAPINGRFPAVSIRPESASAPRCETNARRLP